MERFDVVIAGAGPAGIACAIALARSDPRLAPRVVVLDRARFPREKPCGGGLTGHIDEALAALGVTLDVPAIASGSAVIACGSFSRRVPLTRPVRVIRREEFDASLVDKARALGVEVREATPMLEFHRRHDGIEIATPRGAIAARVLVGADGAGSRVRKRLRPREGVRPIRLFRLEIAGRSPFGEAMLYDFSPMAEGLRGYVWIFPVPGDRMNVGLMHDAARDGSAGLSGAKLEALLRRALKRHDVVLDTSARGWPAWGYLPSGAVSERNILTIGDAAGIDGLTGEGIAVGMEQALVAARAICAALKSGDFSFRTFRADLRRATVGRELALDRLAARLLYTGDGWRRWLPLVLFDDRMLELYVQRVSGTLVLADHKRALIQALVRHAILGRGRTRRMLDALA